MMNDALQAQNDPQQRKDFLSRSLNIYTSSIKAYFNINEFRSSDKKYNWTLEELAKLKIDWYGGADLSKMHDLTAASLIGNYNGIDIIIPHAWFPITAAYKKAEEDNIHYLDERMKDGSHEQIVHSKPCRGCQLVLGDERKKRIQIQQVEP